MTDRGDKTRQEKLLLARGAERSEVTRRNYGREGAATHLDAQQLGLRIGVVGDCVRDGKAREPVADSIRCVCQRRQELWGGDA